MWDTLDLIWGDSRERDMQKIKASSALIFKSIHGYQIAHIGSMGNKFHPHY
jgi:hypothetical protein